MDEFPDELLIRILEKVSSYEDIQNTHLVSKRWYRVMRTICKTNRETFIMKLKTNSLTWRTDCIFGKVPRPKGYGYHIAKHSGVIYLLDYDHGSDEWDFHKLSLGLDSCVWSEVQSEERGAPPPRRGFSLVAHKEKLVLHGGTLFDRIFYDTYLFDTKSNKWEKLGSVIGENNTDHEHPEARFNHSVSVAGNSMVLFGGIGNFRHSFDDVWILDLNAFTWRPYLVTGKKPHPRHSASQSTISHDQVIIFGGTRSMVGHRGLKDMWLLNLRTQTWSQVSLGNSPPKPLKYNVKSHTVMLDCYIVVFEMNYLSSSSDSGDEVGPNDSSLQMYLLDITDIGSLSSKWVDMGSLTCPSCKGDFSVCEGFNSIVLFSKDGFGDKTKNTLVLKP